MALDQFVPRVLQVLRLLVLILLLYLEVLRYVNHLELVLGLLVRNDLLVLLGILLIGVGNVGLAVNQPADESEDDEDDVEEQNDCETNEIQLILDHILDVEQVQGENGDGDGLTYAVKHPFQGVVYVNAFP